MTTLRVFPNWRDFQPVEPAITGAHKLREYILAGDRYPENPYFLDETMLDRFAQFCAIAQEYGMKLIVGLITGWMSGRLYIPAALYEKNIFTDPTAIYFQQLFLKGFVERMKDQPSIYAWDLGNECNCMDEPPWWSTPSGPATPAGPSSPGCTPWSWRVCGTSRTRGPLPTC